MEVACVAGEAGQAGYWPGAGIRLAIDAGVKLEPVRRGVEEIGETVVV